MKINLVTLSEDTLIRLYHSLDYYIRGIWKPVMLNSQLIRLQLVPNSFYAKELKCLMKIDVKLAICYIIAVRYPFLRIYTRNIWLTVYENNPLMGARQIYQTLKEANII